MGGREGGRARGAHVSTRPGSQPLNLLNKPRFHSALPNPNLPFCRFRPAVTLCVEGADVLPGHDGCEFFHFHLAVIILHLHFLQGTCERKKKALATRFLQEFTWQLVHAPAS